MLKSCVVIETVRRVEALGRHRGEDLPLVAEAPRADPLALEVGDRRDAVARPRHLQGAGLLEHLRDVGELDAGASSVPSTFGTQAMAKSTSPATSASCGTMSPPEGMISTSSKPSSSK